MLPMVGCEHVGPSPHLTATTEPADGSRGRGKKRGGVASRLWMALSHPEAWEPAAVGLSIVTVALMVGSRRLHPAVPGVLLASLFGWGFYIQTG